MGVDRWLLVLLVLLLLFHVPPSSCQSDSKEGEAVCHVPLDLAVLQLPGLKPMDYKNWAGDIYAPNVWTYSPRRPEEIPQLANWAALKGWRLRALGNAHSWSPITVTNGTDCTRNYLMLKTADYLNTIRINPPMVVGLKQEGRTLTTVTVQTGVILENLLAVLQEQGLGLASFPTIGSITIGGALAVNAHGTTAPTAGEKREMGHGFGSLSNLIVDLVACVYDAESMRYILRRYTRSERAIRPFLTHLGRAFITEVTLQVGVNQRFRCQSFTDIPATTLFAAPGSAEAIARGATTIESLIRDGGRVDVLWFPFTKAPWLKYWTLSPTKPRFSREVTSPYNYVFSQNFPRTVSDMLTRIMRGDASLTPVFGNIQLGVVSTGLMTSFTYDIWGWSRDLFIYLKQSSLRFNTNGYAIVCARSYLQQVISDLSSAYSSLLTSYANRGLYPMNYAFEIRVSALDVQTDVDVPSSGPPLVSSIKPDPRHPDRDTAVWINLSTFPGTPGSNEFYTDYEKYIILRFDGDLYAQSRPEWSKGWGYTDRGAWLNGRALTQKVPLVFSQGFPLDGGWDEFVAGLQASDPYQVFTNEFLQAMLKG